MSEQSYQAKAKRFTALVEEGAAAKENDPARALAAFRNAKAIFPTADGIDAWVEHLEARLRKERAASQAAQKPAPTSIAASTSAEAPFSMSSQTLPASVNQNQIKQWVLKADKSARLGHISEALHYLDHALETLESMNGPDKVILRILNRRNKIAPNAEMLYRSAVLLEKLGDPELAMKRLDAALQLNSDYEECLWTKVELAEANEKPHQLQSSLMALSKLYERTQQFKKYDDVQRRSAAVRNKVIEWSGEFAAPL